MDWRPQLTGAGLGHFEIPLGAHELNYLAASVQWTRVLEQPDLPGGSLKRSFDQERPIIPGEHTPLLLGELQDCQPEVRCWQPRFTSAAKFEIDQTAAVSTLFIGCAA